MEYHTAYFRQDSEGNLSSLALQQVYHKRKKLPIVFACVGWSQEGGTTPKPAAKTVSDLMDWFYARGLQQSIKKGEGGIYRVGGNLRRQLIARQMNASVVGMLGVGECLCMFSVGKASIRVLNLQKGAASSKELQLAGEDKYGIGMQYARMEPGVGVMLGTDGFWEGVADMCVEECLNIKELHGNARVEKRLWELGKQGETQGGTHMAAVLLVTG